MQSRVWAWGDGVARLGPPPAPRCDLWFLIHHPALRHSAAPSTVVASAASHLLWERWVMCGVLGSCSGAGAGLSIPSDPNRAWVPLAGQPGAASPSRQQAIAEHLS